MAAKNVVLSLRFFPEQGRRLRRLAHRLGITPSEAGARLVEEGLRRSEFTSIDFRDTPAGRTAYLQGTRLPVWMVVKIARSYRGDVAGAAEHLQRPPVLIQAALNYAERYPGEIEEAISENDEQTPETLRQLLPNLQVVEVPQ